MSLILTIALGIAFGNIITLFVGLAFGVLLGVVGE